MEGKAEGRKVYPIPKYIDDLPAVVFIPIDIFLISATAFMIAFVSFNPFIGAIVGPATGFAYYHFRKGKPRNFLHLIFYKTGLASVKGAVPPTEKEIKA